MPIIDDQIIYTTKCITNKQKLIQLGFELNENNEFLIKPSELYKIFPTSNIIRLDCICDYCNKYFSISCKNLNRSQGKSITKLEIKEYQDNLILCKICRTKLTINKRYNCNTIAQITEANEKRKRTNLYRYGVTNVFAAESIKEKIKQTNLQRYGVCIPLQNEDIKEKMRQTNLARYGMEYVIQVPIIQEKIKRTNNERYGVDNAMQNLQIQAKVRETLYKNNTVATSQIQLYLFNILIQNKNNKDNIQLNYPFYNYSLDIAFINEQIDLEYNGGGHDLSVKLGGNTYEQFNQREIKRNYFLIKNNWKQIFIISKTDKWYYQHKFTKEQILKLIYTAKQYLLNTDHHWVKIYIEENKFETSIHIQTIVDILNK